MLEAHFANMLAGAGVQRPRETAREIWLLSEGAISLILVHRDRSYAAAAAQAAKKLLRYRSTRTTRLARGGKLRLRAVGN